MRPFPSLSILALAGLLALALPGGAGATAVQVQAQVNVRVLQELHREKLPKELVTRFLESLKAETVPVDLKPWDYSDAPAHYRMVLRLEVAVPGSPPAIDVFLDIYKSAEEKVTLSKIIWRDVDNDDPFGGPGEVAIEIQALLRRTLLVENGGPLHVALRNLVPVGSGGEVKNLKSVMLALSEQRHRGIGASSFNLHCPQGLNAHLYCLGTSTWHSSSSLEAIPHCLADNETGGQARPTDSKDPDIPRKVVKLRPEDIYLYSFSTKNDNSTFRPLPCL